MNPVDSLFESINFTFQDTSGKANKLSHADEIDKFLLEIDLLAKVPKTGRNDENYTGFDTIFGQRRTSFFKSLTFRLSKNLNCSRIFKEFPKN